MKTTVEYHPKGAIAQLNDLIQLQYWTKSFGNELRRTNQVSGVNRSLYKSRGLDFEEVRVYQQGDDIRSIDWRVTARSGKPHTKLFREEKERPVYFLVDQSPSMFFGSRHCFKAVMANHIAGLLAWSALQHGDRVGGLVFNQHGHQEIKARRSQKQVLRLCQLLVTYNEQLAKANESINTKDAENPPETFAQALGQLSQVAKPGSRVFIISDFSQYNERSKAVLSQLRKHTDVNCFVIHDSLEQNIPSIGEASFSTLHSNDGDEDANSVAVNTNAKQFKAYYKNAFASHQNMINSVLDDLLIPHFSVATHEPLIDKLQQVFQ